MRGIVETVEVFRAQTLAIGGSNIFSTQFPLGEGWLRMGLRFSVALTIGTGSSARSEGELEIIKSITLRTSRGEYICNNVPGRFLYKLAQIKNGTLSTKDAIAASSATYVVPIDIFFSDPLMEYPDDTILNTARYNNVQLEVQFGTVADLLDSVGTSSITATLDCFVDRMKGRLTDAASLPTSYVEYGVMPPQNPSSQTFIDLTRAKNLAYKRLVMGTLNSATAGVPFTGTLSNAVASAMNVEDDKGFPMKSLLTDVVRRKNKSDYKSETLVTGIHTVDFVLDGSNRGAYFTGDSSLLRVNWTNDTLSTSQVVVGYEALKKLVE